MLAVLVIINSMEDVILSTEAKSIQMSGADSFEVLETIPDG
jgi:hypothetical protein